MGDRQLLVLIVRVSIDNVSLTCGPPKESQGDSMLWLPVIFRDNLRPGGARLSRHYMSRSRAHFSRQLL